MLSGERTLRKEWKGKVELVGEERVFLHPHRIPGFIWKLNWQGLTEEHVIYFIQVLCDTAAFIGKWRPPKNSKTVTRFGEEWKMENHDRTKGCGLRAVSWGHLARPAHVDSSPGPSVFREKEGLMTCFREGQSPSCTCGFSNSFSFKYPICQGAICWSSVFWSSWSCSTRYVIQNSVLGLMEGLGLWLS